MKSLLFIIITISPIFHFFLNPSETYCAKSNTNQIQKKIKTTLARNDNKYSLMTSSVILLTHNDNIADPGQSTRLSVFSQ